MRIDHVGCVVSDIAAAANILIEVHGYAAESELIEVPSQKIQCQYVCHPEGLRIQLIKPTDPRSPVANALKRGGGLHHICYECQDLIRTIECSKKSGAVLVADPFPGEGVGGRMAAFIMDPHLGLIEYVEGSRE